MSLTDRPRPAVPNHTDRQTSVVPASSASPQGLSPWSLPIKSHACLGRKDKIIIISQRISDNLTKQRNIDSCLGQHLKMRARQPSRQRSGCFPRAEGSITVGSESVCWGHRWGDCSLHQKWREAALFGSRYRKIVELFIRHHPLPLTPSPPLTPASFP